jgi:manganese-dependent ADP-ribose/CDP-alcohol diphosphatase
MHRRRFLATTAVAVAGSPFVGPAFLRAADPPALSLGLVADPQYADAPAAGTRFYRQSIAKLTEVVAHFNQRDLAFCVNLGDLIDRDWRSYDAILAPLAKSRHPFHHALGNHDFEVAPADKPRVPARLGLAQRWYAVERSAWCFVVLDTNDVSLHAHPEKTPPHDEAVAELKRFAATGARNAQTWNGAVGDRQLRWFEATCQAASKAGQRVIVFAHHPVYPDGEHNAWNATRLLEALDRHRNVVAWLNGHNHAGALGVQAGVPCITLKGMVETEGTNAYAVAHLHADRLELVGHGREPSRELPFRSA